MTAAQHPLSCRGMTAVWKTSIAVLQVLQRELLAKLRLFTPQGVENVLWSFATLAHHPGTQ